ncbi:hypothetical protein KYJ26_16875 [Bacillus sp. MCCB 382]|uniref:hypothetical protein n=1 Tax=Bacillus sp. MCCB 382 TaxID=2860197 RepID=UPI001C55E1AD|nr:hypothetical protein [Bacillus sp. MCCB 382]
MNEIVIVSGDDWEGIYVDGGLEYEDHEVYQYLPDVICDYKTFESCEEKHLNSEGIEWLELHGRLPQKLSEVPAEYLR